MRVRPHKLRPFDVIRRNLTVATVIGDASGTVYVSVYAADGSRVELELCPTSRITVRRP